MRYADWPQRLDAYIAERMDTPFTWGAGQHDCCSFAAGAVVAMTGTNPISDYHYGDERGALRLIRDAGSLDALACRVLGEPIPVAFAGRGDVVMADLERGATIGVCLGPVAAFPAAIGLVHRPTLACRAAWRIE
jgi:hypothetical protein